MAKHVYRGSQSLLDVQGEENTPAAKDQELVATLSVESEQQEEQQEQKLAALLTVEETRQTDEEQQRLVALLDVQETRGEDTRTQEVIALLDVLDEVPPIPVNPPQGLQAELGLIYLYNPDAANSLIQELNLTIEEVNDAVQDITQLTVDAMKIKPYSLLGEPIAQNTPCTFDGCIYVAVATIAQKDPVFNPAQWAKVGTADYNKLYNKPDFITRSDLSCTATGLTYSQETGVLSLTSGYVIPTVAKISQIDTGIATNATNLTLETQQREEAVSNANARINALETGLTAETTDRVAADSSMANNISSLNGRLVAHETNHNNPHQVTKAQIGLGNVNNTADLDKPISTATQQALNALSGQIGTTDAKFDDYRTAAQQDIVDNQIRIEISNVSQAVTLEEAARLSADATINNKINSIEEVIPSSATASNMLADRAFVNSSINSMAAYYITASASGNAFGDHARLISGPWYFQGELRTPTLNDYALVISDETHDNKSARYLYDGAQWAFQYTLNNTEFTQDQINAINSTITKSKVDDYDAHIIDYSNPHNVTKAQVGLSNVDNTSDLNKPVSTATQQALAQKQDIINDLATIRAGAALGATAVQPADLAAYETTAHASATYQLKGDYATTSAMNVALAGKQNVLTAGTGVTIENDVISVTFPSTIAWGNITGNINNQTDLKNALNYKQDKLTAGTNITIDENNVISVTGGSTIVVDQTYNPNSTNPQSGTAVAGAIGNATITFKQGGVVKGRITTNQTQSATIDFDAGGSVVNIDNTTITLNNNEELQAVATVNQNTTTGATNPVYDWVGTLAEYNAQNIETLHPDWLCYITDDVSGGGSVYTKTQVDSLLTSKVSTGHEVIAFQAPTAQNNYTWYRKYADGWVEQGGMNSYGTGTTSNTVIPLLVPMASTLYDTITSAYEGAAGSLCPVIAKPMATSTSTTLEVLCCYSDGGTLHAWGGRFTWRVSGMAA